MLGLGAVTSWLCEQKEEQQFNFLFAHIRQISDES